MSNKINIIPNTITLKTLDGKSSATLAFFGAFRIGETDFFAVHIVEGFDAIFGDVITNYLTVNGGMSLIFQPEYPTDYEFTSNENGALILQPTSETIVNGESNVIAINPGGDVKLGDTSFRWPIRTLNGDHEINGAVDSARLLRMTGAGDVEVTINRNADAPDPTYRLFQNDFFVVQRNTENQVTIVPGHGDVTITNAYTGAEGSISILKEGGQAFVRCLSTNTYEVWGDIPKRMVGNATTLTSFAGSLVIDLSKGNDFIWDLTEDMDTDSITFTNIPEGVTQHILIFIRQPEEPVTMETDAFDNAITFTWFGGVYQPTPVGEAIDEVAFTFHANGKITVKYSNDPVGDE